VKAPAVRVRNPVIPGNAKDRTGTAGILRRANATIRQRFAGLQAEALAIFARIRVYQANDVRSLDQVLYGLTPQEMAQVAEDLQAAADRWMLQGREAQSVLWWDAYSGEAQQLGTAQTVANITNLSPVYAAGRTLQQVIFSEAYASRAAAARFKSYEHWRQQSAEVRSSLAQIIGRAVVDGKNPRAVRKEIAEALDVSKSKALSFAQTDITDTLRMARVAEADFAAQTYGLALGLLWTSALIPTTRPWHASRNGQVYSSNEVRLFYQQRGNRYNCRCATTEALLDSDGAPILTDSLRTAMEKEKAVWQKAHAKG
jgi:SPP1 gp7 family putative phage head morphogenesis protein